LVFISKNSTNRPPKPGWNRTWRIMKDSKRTPERMVEKLALDTSKNQAEGG